MTALFRQPLTPLILAAVALVLALAGAFGTDRAMSLAERGVYWLIVVFVTFALGHVTGSAVYRRLSPRLTHRLRIVSAGLACGLSVSLAVVAMNRIAFGGFPDPAGALELVGTIMAIALIVTVVLDTVQTQRAQTHGTQTHGTQTDGAQTHRTPGQAPAPPALLSRLPPEKRGPLVALSVEDHYVRIRTDKGDSMVLMRLSDAIGETAPVRGLKVHRSHWVALDQVTGARRDGQRAILSLRHGGDVPVSRSHLKALRDAGIAPR